MKNLIKFLIPAIFLSLIFISCNNNDEYNNGGYQPIPATNVTLNSTTADLDVGDSLQLTATVLPENATDRNVTWSSNDTTVATVNNAGLVTAISVGKATITVTTVDGNHTAICVVTVSEPPPPAKENKTVPLTIVDINYINRPLTIDSLNNLRNLYAIDTLFIVFPCRWAGRPASTVAILIDFTKQLLNDVSGTNYGAEYVNPDAIEVYDEERLKRINITVHENTIRRP